MCASERMQAESLPDISRRQIRRSRTPPLNSFLLDFFKNCPDIAGAMEHADNFERRSVGFVNHEVRLHRPEKNRG